MSEDKGVTAYDDLPEHPGYTEFQKSGKAPPTKVKMKKQKQRRIDVRP